MPSSAKPNLDHEYNQRDTTVDTVRGLAILLMIPANMSSKIWLDTHPFWFRLIGSFAAPTFILIAGLMCAYGLFHKKHGAGYFLKRGLLIMCIGAAIDIAVWNVIPFTSCDVLYLIGLALPAVYFFQCYLKPRHKWMILFIIIAGTPFLQNLLTYSEDPAEFTLGEPWGVRSITPEHPTSLANAFLVDGWFPIFPWISFAMVGAMIAEVRTRHQFFALSSKFPIGSALLLIVAGGVLWAMFPGNQYLRDGYSELFYPPTPGFVIASIGLVSLLLQIVKAFPAQLLLAPLRILGESAMLAYIMHLAAIRFLINPAFQENGVTQLVFWKLNLILVLGLIATGILVRIIKRHWSKRPLPVRIIIG